MKLDVISCPKGFAPIVILQTLAENASKEKPITCKEIVEILQDEFTIERKSVERIVKQLKYAGVPINGVNEISEDYEEPEKNFRISRSGIYLERDFSDENLQLLIDSVLYSKYISKAEAEELMKKIRDMGSATFQKKNKGIAKLSSVYHARETRFFKELNVIQQAIAQEKKLSFSYGTYKENNGKFVIEERDNTVSPYHLVFSNGKYYLIGYREEKNQIWHYRVDKIYKAKIESGDRKPITDTALKGVSIGDYVLQHPFLFTGDAKRIVMKVNSDQIGHVVDTFGENFQRISYDKLTTTIAVNCAEDDAYYWALQFSGIVEVLEPQNLRARLRVAAEELTMRYSGKAGDRYEKALRHYEHGGTLELYDIPLKGKTKHQKLKNVRNLRLADNGLTDVLFISNYLHSLRAVCIYNNPVQDLSVLKDSKVYWLELDNLDVQDYGFLKEMPALKTLSLKLSGCEDYSALGELSQLESLRFSCPNANLSFLKGLSLHYLELNVGETDYSPLYEMVGLKRLTIPFEVKEKLDEARLLKNNPELCISTDEGRRNAQKHNMALYGDNAYPRKVLHTAFGHTKVHIGKKDEIIEAVEKIFDSFPEKEKQVARLYFSELKTKEEIAKQLSLSVAVVQELVYEVAKKLRSDYYNAPLRKFVEEHDWNRNYSLKDIIK